MSNLSRRGFFKVGLAASGALVLTYCKSGGGIPVGWSEDISDRERYQPESWLRIDKDGTATVIIPRLEMGQGVETTLALAIAEELGLPREHIRTEMAPVSRAYAIKGRSSTGASDTMYRVMSVVQKAGATAREMLKQAAAKKWSVEAETLKLKNGQVVDGSGRSLAVGALYQDAVKLKVPTDVTIKSSKDWAYLGRSQKRFDVPGKCDGSTKYSMDLSLPGMKVAVVIEPDLNGAWLKSFDASEALKIEGVHAAYKIGESYRRTAVGLVADSFWLAEKARKLVTIEAQPPRRVYTDDQDLESVLSKAMTEKVGEDRIAHMKKGDAEAKYRQATKQIEAVYDVGYQAHQCLEPAVALAEFKDGDCHIYTGTQNPYTTREWVAGVTGLDAEQVHIHNQYTGGAFGARVWPTAPSQAAEIAKLHGTPIKLMYNRSDEFLNTYMHGRSLMRMRAGIGQDGQISSWQHMTSTSAHNSDAIAEGLREFDYQTDNLLVESVHTFGPVRCRNYRSVGRLHNVFARECFMDEVAVEAGEEPMAYRLAYVTDHRLKACYEKLKGLIAEEAELQWGIAGNASRQNQPDNPEDGSRCAIAIASNAEGRIQKVIAVVDCGVVFDPDIVVTQIEGSVNWGLSTALHQEINLVEGKVKQRNFDTAQVLRMADAPGIDVHLIESQERPGGVGELAVPMVMAATANAIYAATGKRLRRLPMRV